MIGMIINTLKEAKHLTETIVLFAGKGFWSFFKNAILVLMVILIMFIGTHPEVILEPDKLASYMNSNSLVALAILFVLISFTYQLARGLYVEKENQNRKKLVNDVEEAQRISREKEIQRHKYLVEKRIENSPKIRFELKDLLIRLGATRAAVCEMHNGTNNLAGIPFLYLDMTYEEISPKVDYVIDNFKNFNLAKYPFIASHIKDMYWSGSIDDLKKEDPYLASRIKLNDTEYGACIVLRGSDATMIGLLVVTFNYNDSDLPDEDSLLNAMMSSGQILATLLDETCLYEIAEAEKMARR
jgi:hypothetical protein